MLKDFFLLKVNLLGLQKLTIEKNSGAGEMYNLANDPNEMNNLYEKFSITPTYFEDWIKKHDWDNI